MAKEINRSMLMVASFLTLIAAGVGFGVRTGILAKWGAEFGFTQFELGTITGGGLVGFGAVIILSSLFADRVGYKSLLILATVIHVASFGITISASTLFASGGKDSAYWALYVGMFLFAIANGLCECVINPLIAQIYPENKTHYLNILHAGWPGGLIVGGLIGLFLGGSMSWELLWASFLIPVALYGFLVVTQPFPKSNVASSNVSFGQMIGTLFAPMLLFIFVLHALVGYVELGTDSWITNITDTIIGQGFVLFIYVNALMFILRFFAGPIVEKTNPLGLLCVSTVLGTTGLLMLGSFKTSAMIWVAFTVYAFGKTFLWPTMLAIVGEQFPRGGALAMGFSGGIGMLSAGLLGSTFIGIQQDYYASQKLTELSKPTYELYQAGEENAILGAFWKAKGLDQLKVGALLKEPSEEGELPFAQTEADLRKLADEGKLAENPTLTALQAWIPKAKSSAAADKEPIKEANVFGAQAALRCTAAVPAAMFFGYLILFLYFRSKGGYKPLTINEAGEVVPAEKHH